MQFEEIEAKRVEFDALLAEHGSVRRLLVPYVRAQFTAEQERLIEAFTAPEDRTTAMLEFLAVWTMQHIIQMRQATASPLVALPNLRQ